MATIGVVKRSQKTEVDTVKKDRISDDRQEMVACQSEKTPVSLVRAM